MANRKPGALVEYINSSKSRRLTPEEENELLLKGDDASIAAVVEANLPLVVSNAMAMGAKGLSEPALMDVIQAGNEELVKAARQFKPSEGSRFCTYATHWIRYGIAHEMANQKCGLVKRPQSAYSAICMISVVREAITQILGRTPTDRDVEVAISGVVDDDVLTDAMSANEGVLSLDAESDPESDDGGTLLATQRSDDVAFEYGTPAETAAAIIAAKVAALDPKQRLLVEARFGIGEFKGNPLTLPQTAEVMAARGYSDHLLTKERVRQLGDKALMSLAKDADLKDLWEGGIA